METEDHELSFLFPGIVSQLRSTLTSLHIAAAQLAPAADRERDPALDLRAARVDQSYYQLLRLMNNLSLAAALADGQTFPPKNLELVQTVSQICEQAGSLAEYRRLDLRFVCAVETLHCAVSRRVLEQILYHLLSNAFKFTPAGGRVFVSLTADESHAVVRVQDTGCGMSAEVGSHIFEKFYQGDTSHATQGNGLGLALVKRVVDILRGEISVESTVGVGTTFTVRIRRG